MPSSITPAATRAAATITSTGSVASWYQDEGGTACGTHYQQGVANKTLPCGTRVQLCHAGCEVAVVEDRGPFVEGREFDLNPGAKAAIACSDICSVRWRVMR
jgi:rare lipoprotein A (peptidoglycan hydrolase)